MLVEENLQVNDTFNDVQLASPPSAVESATDSSLDRFIDREAGIRVWMVLALIMGCMLVVTITVCCIIKIRIPRTKREIEMMTQRRKLRKQPPTHVNNMTDSQISSNDHHVSGSRNVIVMQSLHTPCGTAAQLMDLSENSDEQLDASDRSDFSPTPTPFADNTNGELIDRKDTTV